MRSPALRQIWLRQKPALELLFFGVFWCSFWCLWFLSCDVYLRDLGWLTKMNERMNEWMTDWMKEWMNEWMNEGRKEWMSEWVNEWMNELMNEWTSLKQGQWGWLVTHNNPVSLKKLKKNMMSFLPAEFTTAYPTNGTRTRVFFPFRYGCLFGTFGSRSLGLERSQVPVSWRMESTSQHPEVFQPNRGLWKDGKGMINYSS